MGTFSIWGSSREGGHEATPGSVGVRNHLHHHLVATGYEGSWSKCTTEAPDALAIGMAVVHIHEVVAAQVVALQVYEPEIQNDHFALGDLSRKKPDKELYQKNNICGPSALKTEVHQDSTVGVQGVGEEGCLRAESLHV